MPAASPFSTLTPEPDRFGRAFLIAAAIEFLAVTAIVLAPRPPPPPVPPSVVQIQILAPAPIPVAKPPPPKPPPPPPVPVPPVPVTPPVLLPPPPAAHHPSPHKIVRHIVHSPPPPPQPVPPTPEPPAPVTAAPPPSPMAEQTAMSRYTGEVRAIILGNLIVPQLLTDEGLAGDCVLQFTIAPDGGILSASVITPSGLNAVNQAALAALRASHLPVFLAGMPNIPHIFTLPVHVSGDQQ